MTQCCQQFCCQKGVPFGPKDSETTRYYATHKPVDYANVKASVKRWLLQVSSFLFLWINSNFVRHSYERSDDSLEGQKMFGTWMHYTRRFNVVGSDKGNSVLSTNNQKMIDIQTNLCKHTECRKKVPFA
ncbi:27688_t:CDS:1 [Gigaspora margarita]|uniref:27688_t:CDS:1 n=1 Tax=Gigaspora margarita TaxID=4874 RepID=A0ABN7X4N5_GIGMA|nr:27688_t:CDS:1 [Gigaspora margarita]